MVLILPAILGVVFLIARIVNSEKARVRLIVLSCPATVILFFYVPIFLSSDWPASYSPLVLHEGPFTWPPGCAPQQYSEGETISISCHDYKNVVPRKLAYDHGFRGLIGWKEKEYFRVGSDALNLQCNYFNETCTVFYVERNVFQ